MINQANILDSLGFHKEADQIDKMIFAQFKRKRRNFNPYLALNTKIDQLNGKIDGLMADQNDMNDTPPEDKNISVMVENKPVEFIEQ